MWFLPLFVVGALAVAVSRLSPREETNRRRLALPPVSVPPLPPGPIAVLGEFVRVGAVPPTAVILYAIAEAEVRGRDDLASDIVRVFVAPVVYQHTAPVPYVPSPMFPRSPLPAAPPPPPPPPLPRVIDVPTPAVEASAAVSPIAEIPGTAWEALARCLAREPPAFRSARHVGQFRQRRERLQELGIDPAVLQGNPQAQRQALDMDLADAHQHAAASGLLEDHLGREIGLPGQDGPVVITLSGVLGVIQCAGLEGAVGWLEQASDRKRFPHTTQVFLRSNGIF